MAGRGVVGVVGLCAGLALACGSRRVEANAAPLISAVTVSPDVVAPEGLVTLGVSAADPDGDELRYLWTVPNGWAVQGRDDGPVLVVRAPAVTSATAAVILTVVDPAGKGTTQVTLLHTAGPQTSSAITFSSLTAQPNPVAPGGTVDVAALAASADGAALTWRAEVSDPAWTAVADGGGARVTAPLAYGRAATVTLYADGATGGHAAARVAVATKPWTAPVVDALVASPTVAAPGGRVQLSAAAHGADGIAVSYAWSIAGDGWSLSPGGASAVATAPSRTAAPATVTVTVTDAAGATAAAVVGISTSDAVPVVDAFSAQPVPVVPGGTVTATVSAHDAVGAAIACAWSIQPSEWSVAASGGAATIHAPTRYGAVGVLTLTASDPWSSTTARLLVSTTPYAAPQIASVLASPAALAPGGSAQLAVAATSPAGLPLSYAWSVAGPGWTVTGSGPSAVLAAPALAGQAAIVAVDVTDAAGATARGAVAVSTTP